MSYTQCIYHIVFSTKHRSMTINEANERNLYAYILGIIQQSKGYLYRIGGIPNHIHILVSIPANQSLSEFIKTLKQASSIWLKNNKEFPLWEGWEEGYAAFTYSRHDLPMLINYIKGQKEHHQKISFMQEYRDWLIEMGFSPDEPFFPKM